MESSKPLRRQGREASEHDSDFVQRARMFRRQRKQAQKKLCEQQRKNNREYALQRRIFKLKTRAAAEGRRLTRSERTEERKKHQKFF